MPPLGVSGPAGDTGQAGPAVSGLAFPSPAPDGSGWRDGAGRAYAYHSGRQLSAIQGAGRARPGGAGGAASCHLCLETGDTLPARGPRGGRGGVRVLTTSVRTQPGRRGRSTQPGRPCPCSGKVGLRGARQKREVAVWEGGRLRELGHRGVMMAGPPGGQLERGWRRRVLEQGGEVGTPGARAWCGTQLCPQPCARQPGEGQAGLWLLAASSSLFSSPRGPRFSWTAIRTPSLCSPA